MRLDVALLPHYQCMQIWGTAWSWPADPAPLGRSLTAHIKTTPLHCAQAADGVWKPLGWALKKGQRAQPLAELLVTKGADVNIKFQVCCMRELQLLMKPRPRLP